MTVEELITELAKMKPDAEVRIWEDDQALEFPALGARGEGHDVVYIKYDSNDYSVFND